MFRGFGRCELKLLANSSPFLQHIVMDFRTRSRFSQRKLQNAAFKINEEVIIRVGIYTFISLLLLLVLAFLNVYFSYKARIINNVAEIPEEISAVIFVINELNLDKIDEIAAIADDFKTMKAENKIDEFYFFVQKREESFPNITALKQRFNEIVSDVEIEITVETTKSICKSILESGINKTLLVSPQAEIIFNVHSCNLADMFAIAYYPNIKNVNYFNGYINRFNEVLTAPLE